MKHAVLSIVKGVMKTPGDSESAEVGIDSIDLLDLRGFSLQTEDGYNMNRPSLKNSSIWSDTPLSAGRQLIAGENGNVVETIRLTLNAASNTQLASMLVKIGRMIEDCRLFWTTQYQIQPVYIKHQVVGEPGPRYALLYNIEMVTEPPSTINEPTRDITLSIEREGGWRGLAPGENPKLWSLQIRRLKPFVSDPPDSSSNTQLASGDSHLAFDIVNNRTERISSSGANVTKNYIDIPGDSIPGDMPALVMLGIRSNSLSASETGIFVSRLTKETSVANRDIAPTTFLSRYMSNLSDASSVIADTTFVSDTGAPKGAGDAIGERSRTTFATSAALSARVSMGLPQALLLRGRFAVFLRARLSAGSTTVQVQLQINNTPYDIKTLTDQGTGGTGNTTEWGVVYMGVITLPQDESPTLVSTYGMGISNQQSTLYNVSINAARTAGAGELYMSDLIFMPIDECASLLRIVQTGAGNVDLGSGNGFIDNTGYLLHGKPDAFGAWESIGTGIAAGTYAELLGQSITLLPGVNNRLIFWSYLYETNRSVIARDLHIFVNIVPRWSGLRDV